MSNKWNNTATASSSRSTTAPRGDRLRCRVDGVWEPRENFSQAQLKKWSDAKQRRKTIEVTCLKHTSGAVHELRCETCGLVKDLNCFSKNARKANGGRLDCYDCISWTEADQVGGRPLPMPGGQRDESEWDLAKTAREEKEMSSNFEDMRISENTVTETHSEYFNDETVKSLGNNLNPGLTTKSLNKFLRLGKSAATPSSLSTHSYHSSSAPTDNNSTVDGMSVNVRPTGRHQQSHLQYRAIGPDGTVQMRTRSIVNASDTASVTTMTNFTTTDRDRGSGNFAKPSTRKTNPDPPDYILRGDPDWQYEQAYDSDQSDDMP